MQLLNLHQVEERVGLKKSKIYKMIQEKRFPPPTKIEFAARWPDTQIDTWIAQQVAQSEEDRKSA